MLLPEAQERKWPVYSIYGVSVASDFPFTYRLATAGGVSQITFSRATEEPFDPDWLTTTPVYASARLPGETESRFHLYQRNGCDIMRYTHRAHFYLWPHHILCQVLDSRYHFAIEIWLLGGVFAYWLERQGIPALHAAAVVVNDQAVAFLSTNKGGKSSLAATLMQLGHPLLSDDILPVELRQGQFAARPGYPQMRMWPDQAQHFVGSCEELDKVQPALSKRRVPVGSGGFGAFCEAARPLRRIYVPQRYDADGLGEITISPLSVKEAVVNLVRNSFLPYVVAAAGLEAKRFGLFANLIDQVPVCRLRYPSGVQHLPAVAEAVLQDLNDR